MQTITISALRKGIKKVFDEVIDSMDIVIVPRKGKEDAVVLISLKEYNALKETDYLLSTEANRNSLAESMKEAEENDVVEFDLDQALTQLKNED